ncbi:MAG: sigma-70 family RNA polymerase sigma factor [Gaiellales bacterium]
MSSAFNRDSRAFDEADDRRSAREREQRILQHSHLARRIGRRYADRGFPLDDIYQAGYIGMINAIDRFDSRLGVPIEAYAARLIEGEIMHLFRDQGWAVRVPRSLQELGRRATKERERLTQSLGRTPTSEELAAEVGESPAVVEDALMAYRGYRAESLTEPGDTESGQLDRFASVLSSEDRAFDRVIGEHGLSYALRRLPVRSRQVILMRFRDDLTQTEIAARIGVSQMQVSRIIRSTLETLKETLETSELPSAG